MANELTISISARSNKNGFDEGTAMSGSFTQAGTNNFSAEQGLSTTAEAIALGDVVAPCVVVISNLDVTNAVTVGADATAVAKKVSVLPAATSTNKPTCLVWLGSGDVLYAVAAAGTPSIKVTAFKL